MIDANQYVRDVFSMLGNLCIPTINHVVKEELILFLSEMEKVLDEKELNYLIEVLLKFDINKIEKKHDQLNIRFVEFTYVLYEKWIEYIEHEINEEFILNFHIDKQFIEDTNEKFITCMLNQEIFAFYRKLHELDTVRDNLIKSKMVSYQDRITGIKKIDFDVIKRIHHVFKVIKVYLNQKDANFDLFKFIEEYEDYCLKVLDRIEELDCLMSSCKEKYLQMCVEVFGKKINELYQELESRDLHINIIHLKLHILDFLKVIVN